LMQQGQNLGNILDRHGGSARSLFRFNFSSSVLWPVCPFPSRHRNTNTRPRSVQPCTNCTCPRLHRTPEHRRVERTQVPCKVK
jgi:hypothetical protein